MVTRNNLIVGHGHACIAQTDRDALRMVVLDLSGKHVSPSRCHVWSSIAAIAVSATISRLRVDTYVTEMF